jgi:medium-chain acyl-[acyl-carrier-protein] hydrolase
VPGEPLNCPITAFGGVEDDEETRERIESWREQTASRFSLRMLPGDHFFLHSAERTLIHLLSRELQELAHGQK